MPEIIINLDPRGMELLRLHDAAFHRWQQCLGPEADRWSDTYAASDALYDHLCWLDDYYAAYSQNGVSFNIRKFRLWRKMVDRRIAKVELEHESNKWITRGRANGHVRADVSGALQNTLQGLLYKTVTKENCMDFPWKGGE